MTSPPKPFSFRGENSRRERFGGRVWDATCGVVDGNGNGVKVSLPTPKAHGDVDPVRFSGSGGEARKKTGLAKLPAATPKPGIQNGSKSREYQESV